MKKMIACCRLLLVLMLLPLSACQTTTGYYRGASVRPETVVSLSDPGEERALFIWIGPAEARAIHSVINGIKHFRPLTHDLLASVIDAVDGKIHRIVITHVKENVFYATILMEKDGRFDEIDARPSDSIVMALKFEAPIFVSRKLFERMSITIKDETRIEDKYGLELQELTAEIAEYLSFAPRRGVMISGVRQGPTRPLWVARSMGYMYSGASSQRRVPAVETSRCGPSSWKCPQVNPAAGLRTSAGTCWVCSEGTW